MRYLYLIRHAKSSWTSPGLADVDRPLNKRGERDVPLMGEELQKRGVAPDLIYTSPAKRACSTARMLAECVGYPVDRILEREMIYTWDMGSILQVIHHTHESVEHLFLVGHNDVLTDLAQQLTMMELGNIPTCGIVGVAFDAASWREVAIGRGRFLFFDYPKKHRRGKDR